jgi:uncharacterized membrane protein YidH (DUF202 family)
MKPQTIYTATQKQSISNLLKEAREQGTTVNKVLKASNKRTFITKLIASFYFAIGLITLVLLHVVYNRERLKYMKGGMYQGLEFSYIGYYAITVLCLVVVCCSFFIVMRDKV